MGKLFKIPYRTRNRQVDRNFEAVAVRFNQLSAINETAVVIPTVDYHYVGDIVWNANPQAGGYAGWICIVEGEPGTWKTFGSISS